MKRSLLGFLVAGLAIVTLAAPTPAEAARVWCGWYGRCYVAYTVVRPVAVRRVVAVQPYYTVAYRRAAVPYRYTAVAYRPAVVPYRTVAYASTAYAYAYVPGPRRVWIYR
jgi:hypothetical protein